MEKQSSIQLERDFELKWRLSARAAAVICQTALGFNSSIEITHGDERADAKSIMSLYVLGGEKEIRPALDAGDASFSWNGLKTGSNIRIIALGADAADALAAIVEVLSRSDLDYG